MLSTLRFAAVHGAVIAADDRRDDSAVRDAAEILDHTSDGCHSATLWMRNDFVNVGTFFVFI